MVSIRFTALFALAYTTTATPVVSFNVCSVLNDVVSGLRAVSTADAFCTSFLSINTATITATATATPSAVLVPDSVTDTASAVTVTSTISTDTTVTTTNSVTITPSAVTQTASITVPNSVSCLAAATTLNVLAAAPQNGKRNKVIVSSTTAKVSSSSTQKSSSSSTNKASVTSSSAHPATSCTVPAALSSYASSAISTACSCLSLTTPSSTTTTTITLVPVSIVSTYLATITPTSTATTTVTNTVTVPAYSTVSLDAITTTVTSTVSSDTIQPTGLSYYYYYPKNPGPNFANLPSVVNSLSENNGYLYSGTVSNINTISNSYDYSSGRNVFTLPNSSNSVPDAPFSMIFQGYFYAGAGAGSYTLSSVGVDDQALAWIGTKAYGAGWNYNNADYVGTDLPTTGASTSFTLAAGEAVPINLYYGNGGGPGRAVFTVYGPDGARYDDTTQFFVGACATAGLFQP